MQASPIIRIFQAQDWNGRFAYAPPLVPVAINLDQVVSAKATDSRGSGPWVYVRLTDGSHYTVQGTPLDFVVPEKE